MKQLSFLIIGTVLIVGCKAPKTITKIETKYRDTTVYVNVPVYVDKIIEVPLPVHDTLKIIEKVYVDKDGQATMKSVHKEKGIIGADIGITNGKLSANLYLTDSTILYNYKDTFNYEDSIKIYNAIKETTSTIVLPPEKYVSKFSKFTHKWFYVSLLLIAVFVTWKIKGAWISDLIKKIK